LPAPKFLKSFRADSLLFGDGFREGDPEGCDSMSGIGVDGCVGAREPDSMGIQIASVTVGGHFLDLHSGIGERCSGPWLVFDRFGLSYSHFGRS